MGTNTEQVIFDMGKQVGELHTIASETQKNVLALGTKLDGSMDVINKRIDDHISIDHVTNKQFMNWLTTVKHYSPHVLLVVIVFLCYIFLPTSVTDVFLKVKRSLGGLI